MITAGGLASSNGRADRMLSAALLRAALLLVFSTCRIFAAVHPYNDDYFYAVADAYIFRGGREGLFASTQEARPAALTYRTLRLCSLYQR